jgi:hypothetical protein
MKHFLTGKGAQLQLSLRSQQHMTDLKKGKVVPVLN